MEYHDEVMIIVIISVVKENIRFNFHNTKDYVRYRAILATVQLHNLYRSTTTVLSSHIIRSLIRPFQRCFETKVLNTPNLFRLIVASWTSVS